MRLARKPKQARTTAKGGAESVVPASRETPALLARAANRHHARCLRNANEMVRHAIKAGQALLAAKEQVGHGHWEDWLSKNCAEWKSQAPRYMRLAREYGDQLANPARASDLPGSIRQALALLPGPTRKNKTSAESPAGKPTPAPTTAAAELRKETSPVNSTARATSSRPRTRAQPPSATPTTSITDENAPATSAPQTPDSRGKESSSGKCVATGKASAVETPDIKPDGLNPDLIVAIEQVAADIMADITGLIQDVAEEYCGQESAICGDAFQVQRAIAAAVRYELANFVPSVLPPLPACMAVWRPTNLRDDAN